MESGWHYAFHNLKKTNFICVSIDSNTRQASHLYCRKLLSRILQSATVALVMWVTVDLTEKKKKPSPEIRFVHKVLKRISLDLAQRYKSGK